MDELELTKREIQCLSLVACGFDDQMIGNEIKISHYTARVHIRNAIKKLGARNKSHAVFLALFYSQLDLEVIFKLPFFVNDKLGMKIN